jgi:hypothetical protein
MIQLFNLEEAFVMDICLTDEGWKIVEINCINSSFYPNTNVKSIIKALNIYFSIKKVIKMFLYDKVIVIDIEATCWEKGQIPENQEENIEIGISTNRLWKANVKNLSQISFQ